MNLRYRSFLYTIFNMDVDDNFDANMVSWWLILEETGRSHTVISRIIDSLQWSETAENSWDHQILMIMHLQAREASYIAAY